MEKAITTAVLIIASIIAALALVNTVLPAMGKSSGALLIANKDAAERIKTDIEIITAVGDATANTITVWVKNIGTQVIKPVNASDVILTAPSPNGVKRLPYVSGCSSGECWDYAFEGGATDWIRAVTVKFTLRLTDVTTGVHSVSISTFNAVSAIKDFSV